jgi:hypothetical protein
MPKFTVPVSIEIYGSITVECDSVEDAIQLAKDEFDRRTSESRKDGHSLGFTSAMVVDGPDIQVDFAHDEDLDEVIDESKEEN